MRPSLIPLSSLSIAIIAALPVRADEAADRRDIVQRARAMYEATFKGDMNAVVEYMHPAAVKTLGGEEKLKEAIGRVARDMKESGLEFVSMEVEPPTQLITRDGKSFAVVKTTTVMQIPRKLRARQESSMIAVRDTPQGTWTFLRVNEVVAQNRDILKQIIPGLPDELVVEPPKKTTTEPLS